MPEATSTSQPPPSSTSSTSDNPGQPYYERERQKLKLLLHKKRELERAMEYTESSIAEKEENYLNSTKDTGNIIVGFDSYVKGGTTAGRNRRGGAGGGDEGKVFSRSSVSFGAHQDDDEAATPTAGTPGFARDGSGNENGDSNHATPTSASYLKGAVMGNGKKNKKGDEEDESERDAKKARVNFGAAGGGGGTARK